MLSLNHIPLLRLLLPFVGGIIATTYLNPNLFHLISAFSISLILYITFLSIKKLNANFKLRWVFGLLLYLNLALAGASLTALKYYQSTTNTNVLNTSDEQLIIGEVTEAPQVKEKTVKAILTIKGLKQSEQWVESEGKVILYLQTDSLAKTLTIGDIVSFEPKLENVPPPKNPNEFDFRKYLSYHLIHQQAFLRSNNWKLVQKSPQESIVKIAHNIRKYFIETLRNKGLEEKELAVASALILGYKDDIDAQLKSAYSSAGAMHVLAVSGLHVGIIFLIFSKLLLFLEKWKWGRITKGIILILILWSYALITGLSPSVMRAATMFSFVVTAKTLDRNSSFFNTLAASAFALLIYNPLLIMEVGFQLSYLAVIGIVIIQPWVNNWFYTKWWLPRKIWEITAVSIAAQIATFPLGLLYFHQFPNYFLLSNLIVIPLALAILCLGIAVLCFAYIPIIGDYLALGLNYLVKFLNYSVTTIDALPYSLSENIKFTIADAWLIYIATTFFILLVAYRKFKYMLVASILIIAFLLINLNFKITSHQQKKLIIYNIPQYSAINFIDGNDNILVSDIKLTKNRSKMLFHTQNNWINNGVNNEKIVRLDHLIKKHQLSNLYRISNTNLFNKRNYFQFYNYKIAVIDNQFKASQSSSKIDIDLIILTKNTKLSIKDILNIYNTKQIVIDASNSTYNRERLSNEAELLNVNYWDITTNGAFEVEL
jgi:competence protein ComEC